MSRGFYAKSEGLYIFSKIFRYIENNVKGKIKFSEENWKMNFTMEQEPEAIKLEGEDLQDALPLEKTRFEAEVLLFAQEGEDEPD
jgi:hypothetical protein